MDFKNALELASYEGTKIVTVGLIADGKILTGKRRDNGKWTFPGGHVDDGEGIFAGAQREVLEEAGITIAMDQLQIIEAKKIAKGRSGLPFVVFCFLAHIEKERATNSADPDKEFSEMKWVKIDKDTTELQAENRHAVEDSILVYLGINKPMEARLKSRTMAQLSKDIQNAGFDENPSDPGKTVQKSQDETKPPLKQNVDPNAPPPLPEPKPKTPKDMKNSPDSYLPDDEVTGDVKADAKHIDEPTVPEGVKQTVSNV